MCTGVGGHNRQFAFFVWELLIWSVVGTMGNMYFQHFCLFALSHFFLESFDLVGGVGGHNGQYVLSAFLHFCTFAFFLGKF